jgi:rhodanese-related sulfurtransferase
LKRKKLDPKKEYAVYCRSGRRSQKVLEIMKKNKILKVKNLGSLQEALRALNRSCVGCQ